MTDSTITRTVRSKRLGNGEVHEEIVSTGEAIDATDYGLIKSAQFLWYITNVVNLVLLLRFVFLLLGANLTGIVLFIYNISEIFILPFRGIFPAPRTGEFYFDTAAVLAIFMYYLLTFIIVKALELMSRDPDQELA